MDKFDVVVIGSGPGGYVAAIRAAQLGMKTACIERYPVLGGTCLNVGCIPSKSLLHSSEMFWHVQHEGQQNGIAFDHLSVNLSQMMQRKQNTVKNFNQGIAGLFKKNQVATIHGHASFSSPNTLQVKNGENIQEIQSKYFIIATGSKPATLPFLPLDEQKVISSTGALTLQEIPQKMLVIGAGVIGVELGSVYSRLGSHVEFIEFLDRICPSLDTDMSKMMQQILIKQNLAFHLSTKVVSADLTSKDLRLTTENSAGEQKTHTASTILVAVGRIPYTQDLELANVGIQTDEKGFIQVDGNFRTTRSHIFAVGDVIGGAMLAHKASEEGIAAVEIIAQQKPKMEYVTIPNVIYTYPEVASVGFTEDMAKQRELEIAVGKFPFKANSRAGCTGELEGLVKIIADKQTGVIIGVHIIGAHAGELIHEGALAMHKRATALDIAQLSHAHPTLSEAMKEAALAIAKQMIHL